MTRVMTGVFAVVALLLMAAGMSGETGSALSAGSWFLKYRQTEADFITVRVNLAAKDIDLSDIELRLTSDKDQSRPE